ncbi:MAG: glycosyltransferase family 4 protein [Candidatus Moranbacteria bacterium]|nr:glycosyltransferase family 4 protein [Candidatus Moranbacteria bacterium]
MKKRIGIDARFYGPFGKGLGRYVQKLIENLEMIENDSPESDREYFVFLRKENIDEYEPKNERFHKVLAHYQWYTFSEQINMPRLLNKYKLDLVHFPHFNIPILYFRPFVATIHDLILLNFPTVRGTTLNPLWYKVKFLAYKLTIGLGIRRARKVIAVSEFTKNDILKHYKSIDEEKIVVTHEACDREEKVEIDAEKNSEILKKYGIIKPYVLYVGNAYPHKNLERLIECFLDINRKNENLHLVLVGKKDYFYEKLERLREKLNVKNVIFAGFIPDKDLGVVYENAKLYVFPSLYEGFGLPPLEAMNRGVPVVSSSHLCMKEILGDAAYYFDGRNEKEMSRAILKASGDDELREELQKKGRKQVSLYSWKKMAQKTYEIYQKFLREYSE